MTTPAIRAALERLLNDLQCLILKSQGVSGLCRDGDLVTWPDLLKPGGCYSPWIGYAIAAARDALDAEPPDPANGENPPPAMLTENELATSWNQQADEFNRWDSLDSGEQLAWAQARAIARDRADRLPDPAAGGEALLAAPAEGEAGEGPILQWTDNKQPCDECRYDHCTAETPFGRFLISWKSWKRFDSPTVDETPWGDWHKVFDSVDAAKAACQREMDERIAHWGRPAAPPAPPKGEVGELVRWLQSTAEGQPLLSDEGYARLTRAATLLQQQAAELASLRAPQGGEVV